MPIFQFQCEKCGAIEERLQKSFNADAEPVCSCGQLMNRKLSPFSFSCGWRLTPESHLPGHKDAIERNV